MRLIDADELIKRHCAEECGCTRAECGWTYVDDGYDGCTFVLEIENTPTVDDVSIDDVAKMLSDLFGDSIACNYCSIDNIMAYTCEKEACPDDGDYSCWKKYVMHWMNKNFAKMDGGKDND